MYNESISALPLVYIELNMHAWSKWAARWEKEADGHPEIPGVDRYYRNLAKIARTKSREIKSILQTEERNRLHVHS